MVRKDCFELNKCLFRFCVYSQNWTLDELHSFFSSFGRISSLDASTEGRFCIGFVKFKRVEAAAKILDEFVVWWCQRFNIRVEAAESRLQPGWHPQLNDDCLRTIFDHLNLWDLVSVADVCPRFAQIAQERFAKMYKTVDFNDLVLKQVDAGTALTGKQIQSFFKHFGSLIAELNISYYDPSHLRLITPSEILLLMVTHCSGSLEVLKLRRTNFNIYGNGFLMTSHSQFARLKNLSMFHCVFNDVFMRSLANCTQLTKLKIVGKYYGEVPLNEFDFTLPALTTISLKNVKNVGYENLRQILQRHPQLNRITISECGVQPQILNDIIQHVPNVEKLSFIENGRYNWNGFETQLMLLARLSSLKKLNIDTSGLTPRFMLNQMVTANVRLDHLGVYDSVADSELAGAIGAMKTLRSLRFKNVSDLNKSHLLGMVELLPQLIKLDVRSSDCRLSAFELMNIIRKAPKLQEIDLKNEKIRLDDKMFKSLVQTVSTRGPPFPLKITSSRHSSIFSGLSENLLDTHKDKVVLIWHT